MSPCALSDPPPGVLAPGSVVAGPEVTPPPADDVFLFPATPAQRRFWLLDGMQPGGNPALNFTLTLWLSGPLDRPALERALAEVGERHEALRTTFAAERGHLRQVVAASPSPFVLPFHDVADYPPDEQDAVAPHFIGQEARTPLDLRRGPLWRARLVRVAASEHFLLLSVHNILCDSWTSGVLVRELGELYNAFHRGAPRSPLPPPTIQFADYADWLAGQLADPAGFGPALDHWRTALAGRLPAVELPADGTRPTGAAASARRLFAEATEAMLLPRDLAAGLKTFAAREGMTLFMVYFAGFLTLLHRLAGETDLVVVTPSANRGRPETEELVGLLVNPLLLRVDVGGNPSVRELLRRVRAASLGAFAHGELPFERIVEEVRPERLPVSFLHQGVFLQGAELAGGLKLTPLPGFSGGALYELLGAVMEEPGGRTRVVFEYNADLFGPETVRRWLGHYQTLLAGLLAAPETTIAELPLLTASERQRLGFGEPAAAGSPELPDLFTLLSARVAESPDAPAAREGRRELSVAELLARLEALGPEIDRETALFGLAGAVAAWRTGGAGAVVEMPAAFGARAAGLAKRLGLGVGEVFGTLTPATEAAAREEAAAALLTGATLVSPRRAGLPADVAGWLTKERVTVAALPMVLAGERPAGLRLILTTAGEQGPGVVSRLELTVAGGTVALDGRAFPGVRLAVCRGAPGASPRVLCPARTPGSFGGTTSVSSAVLESAPSANSADDTEVVPPGDNLDEAPQPARGGSLRALPEPQPLGVPGELVVALGDGEPIHTGETFRRRADGVFERIVFSPTAEASATPAVAPEAPWLTLHHQLIAIWEDVLGVAPVGLRDDFFNLGGNSVLALRMLARLEETCGYVVLPVTLFTHPTVAGLAEEIAREETRTAPAILAVRESGSRPPLFFLHGDLAGGGFYCRKLAGQLGEEQPFYALPPADVRRLPPGQTIESMAASHLAALREVRPHGPYRLGGFCLGGLVAFEVAQRLVADGETVENLLLIDVEPLAAGARRLRRITDRLARMRSADAEEQLRRFTRGYYLLARLRRWRGLPWREQMGIARRRLLGRRAGLTIAPTLTEQCCTDGNLPAPTPEDANRGWDAGGAFLWAAGGYRPRPYAGRVSLLLSTDLAGPGNPENPTARWRRLAPRLQVRNLEGSHLACLTNHVAALGAVMGECLEEP